jgi:hypothetical protein
MSGLWIWLSISLGLAIVINYASSVMLQIEASLTDDSRGIIYDGNMFIVQAKEEEHRNKI